MFLNSSGITSNLNWLDFKKLANFLSRKSLQTFFLSSRISARYIPNYFVLLGACFRTCSPICLFIGEKSNKIYNQIPKQASNKDIEMAGNDWKKEWIVDSSSMMQHGKETEMQKCIIVWSRWTFAASNWRKILVSIKRYYLPWWLFRSACYYYPLVYYLKLPV